MYRLSRCSGIRKSRAVGIEFAIRAHEATARLEVLSCRARLELSTLRGAVAVQPHNLAVALAKPDAERSDAQAPRASHLPQLQRRDAEGSQGLLLELGLRHLEHIFEVFSIALHVPSHLPHLLPDSAHKLVILRIISLPSLAHVLDVVERVWGQAPDVVVGRAVFVFDPDVHVRELGLPPLHANRPRPVWGVPRSPV